MTFNEVIQIISNVINYINSFSDSFCGTINNEMLIINLFLAMPILNFKKS